MSIRPLPGFARGGWETATRMLALALMLALVLTVTGAGAAVSPAQAIAVNVLVSGTVYADDGTTPVPGCRVVGTDGPGGHSYAAMTDATGAYTLSVPLAEPIYDTIKIEFDPYDTNKANDTTFVHSWYGGETYEYASDVDVSSSDQTGIDQSLTSGAYVSGRVTDESSAGVAASVRFTRGWSETVADYTFVTGADGRWDGYVDGDWYYFVKFVPDTGDLVAEWWDDATSYYDASQLEVPAPDGLTGIDAVLSEGGSISGTVTDPEGALVEGDRVFVLDSTESLMAEAQTDENGYYKTSGLPTGDYEVQFDSVDGAQPLVAEVYDDKADDEAPNLVHVEAPAETGGISAQLGYGATISGRVTDASGTPIPGVLVMAQNPYGWWEAAAETYTGGDGRYSMPSLRRDTYAVYFDTAEANEALDRDLVSTDREQEAHADTTFTLDVELAKGARISGKVTGPSGAALEGIQVALEQEFDDWDDMTQTTVADGTFVLRGIAEDRYLMHFDAYDYNYTNNADLVSESWNNVHWGSSATQTVIAATPGMRMTANAQLEQGVRVSGKLKRADTGAGIDGNVVLMDTAGHNLDSAMMNEGGNYVFRAVLPGSYKLFGEAWDDSELMGRFYPSAQTLSAASTVSVTLPGPKTGMDISLPVGGWISGTVRGDSGAPLEGVEVRVLDSASGDWVSDALTEADGTYVTPKNVDTGSYKVRLDPTDHDEGMGKNYAIQYYNQKATFAAADIVNVTVATAKPSVNATLVQNGAVFTGVVRNSDGVSPALEGSFVAEAWQYSGGVMSLVGQADVDPDTGTYRLRALPAGAYYLAFESPWGGFADYPIQFVANNGAGPKIAVETTAFADTFALAASTTSTVDFTAVRGAHEHVLTVDQAGDPVPGVGVRIWRNIPGRGWRDVTFASGWSGEDVTDGDGEYVLWSGVPGDYRFEFSKAGYPHTYYEDALTFDTATIVAIPELVSLPDCPEITQAMTVDDVAPVTDLYAAGVVRAAGSTVGWLRSASATIGLVPSEAADTFARVDSGAWTKTTGLTVSKQGTTTIAYYSVDPSLNRETTKTVRITLDSLAPVTTAPSTASYVGTVTVPLTAVDAASGVDWTRWSVDAGSTWTTGTSVLVTGLGSHTIHYRSADVAGNTEATKSVTFSIVDIQSTSITIKTSATTARIGNIPILSGAVTPYAMVGKVMVVYVMKPGKTYWTYSSNRTVYIFRGSAAWLYKYYFKPGMTKGYYKFKAVMPATPGYLASTSPTTVSIRLQ